MIIFINYDTLYNPYTHGWVVSYPLTTCIMVDCLYPMLYVGQELKEILISMEKAKVKKPFLGGYKNQLTEIEYHHASAQTLPKSNLGTGV